MTRYLLLFLFVTMLAAPVLGLDLSLAPGLSVKNAILYAVVFGMVLQTAVLRNRRIEMQSVIVPFGLLVAYAFLTWLMIVLIVDYKDYRALQSLVLLKSGLADQLLVFLVFFYGLQNSKDTLWLIRMMVWVVIVGNLVTVIDGLDIPDLGLVPRDIDGRITGPIGEKNEYGAFLTFFLPPTIAICLTSNGGRRIFGFIGLLAAILCLLMTGSRGAFVAVLLGAVVGVLYGRSYLTAQALLRGVLGLALLTGVSILVLFTTDYGAILIDRLLQTKGGGSFSVSSGRTTIWSLAIEKMLEHPVTLITGYGWNAYESSRHFRYATHSVYVSYLYDIGLVGLSLFVAAAINVIRAARGALTTATEMLRPYFVSLVFGFISLLIAAAFVNLYKVWFFIWAFSGAVLRLAILEAVRADVRR